jgi:hypothetical protein
VCVCVCVCVRARAVNNHQHHIRADSAHAAMYGTLNIDILSHFQSQVTAVEWIELFSGPCRP